MQVCFAVWNVWSRARFLVAPLPKRLLGGNTASGCPCPSLFFSLLLSCSLSLIFPLVSHVPSSPPSPLPISVCLCCFLRSEHCCGTGLPPRNKAEFSIHISASVPPFYFPTSLLQLSFSTSVLLFCSHIHPHPFINPPTLI